MKQKGGYWWVIRKAFRKLWILIVIILDKR